MNEIFVTGANSLRTASDSAARNSERVVRAFIPDPEQEVAEDIVDAVTGLQQDMRQAQASVAIVRAGDEMVGRILDIIA